MRRYALIPLLCALALAQDDEVKELVKQLGSKEPELKLEAARAAATVKDKAVTSPLIKLLKDKNPAVRDAAIEALGMRRLSAEKKKASRALAGRIKTLQKKKEEGRAELLVVCEALHELAQPNSLDALLDIGLDDDRQVAAARMRAAANIPSKKVIEELMQLASAGRRGGGNWRRQEALKQLRYATQENVRGNVDEWRRWWSDHKATFDPDIAANTRADARLKQEEADAKRKERKARRGKKKKKKKDEDGDT